MSIDLRIKSAIMDLMVTSEEPLTDDDIAKVEAFYLFHPEFL